MVPSPGFAPGRLRRLVTLALVVAGGLPLAAGADTAFALLTLTDGPVDLLRSSHRHAADEGLALVGNDMLRTGATTRVARIEFADGRVLDLGPDTQALLPATTVAAAAGLPGATAVVLSGWAKLSVPAAVAASVGAGSQLATQGLLLQVPPAGTVLLQVATDGSVMVFAESRGATLLRRPGNGIRGAIADTVLREGDTWARAAGSMTGSHEAGPRALRKVPPALADALPRRWNRMSGLAAEPGAGEPVRPGDLVAWTSTEPVLMAALQPRTRLNAGKSLRKPATKASLPTPVGATPPPAAPIAQAAVLDLPARFARSAGLPALASMPASLPASLPASSPTPTRVVRLAAPTASDTPRRR